MAQVPLAEQTIFPSGSSPMPQASPVDFGAGMAQAQAGVAQQIGQGADVLAKHALIFQQIQNETNVNDAYNQFSGTVRDTLWGPNGYYSLQGKAAVDGLGATTNALAKQAQDMRTSLPNPAQQRMFDTITRRRLEQELDSMASHAQQENLKWRADTSDAFLKNTIADAAAYYNDDRRFAGAINSGLAEIQAYGADAGWSKEQMQAQMTAFTADAWKARFQRVADENPDQAEAMFAANKDQMDGLTQVEVAGIVRTAKRQVLYDQSISEHQADKQLRQIHEDTSKQGWALWGDGKLTADWVQGNINNLDQGDFTALLKAAKGGAEGMDDMSAVIDLTKRLATEDVSAAAESYLRHGQITLGKYQDIMARNRAALKDDLPASPYKSARSMVDTALNPGLLTGPGQQIYRVAQANALADVDAWNLQNPGASREAFMAEAQRVIKQYQIVNFSEMTMTVGLPTFYTGTADAMKPADLDADEAKTLGELDAGRWSKEQAATELRRIEAWRQALANKAPDNTVKPPADTGSTGAQPNAAMPLGE